MGLPQTYTSSAAEIAQERYAFDLWKNQGNDDDPLHRHLINAFRVAVREELTDQQRTYILAYYYEHLTMGEIAQKYAVNKSTVCRTVKRARDRLERVLRYASPALLNKEGYVGIRTSNNKSRKRSA